jgi:hypothetical protein
MAILQTAEAQPFGRRLSPHLARLSVVRSWFNGEARPEVARKERRPMSIRWPTGRARRNSAPPGPQPTVRPVRNQRQGGVKRHRHRAPRQPRSVRRQVLAAALPHSRSNRGINLRQPQRNSVEFGADAGGRAL